MTENGVLILRAEEVRALLANRERELMSSVRAAYEAHGDGKSSLPHSTFLRFQHQERSRIIALPAYLGGEFDLAGVKWISSFPTNAQIGLDRASAVVVLNSATTGRVKAIIEGSIISAKRTAASAALAAQCLSNGSAETVAGFIGCGPINFEIARFLLATFPQIEEFVLFDLDRSKAKQFEIRCRENFDIKFMAAENVEDVFRRSKLISFATTAVQPHVLDVAGCAPGACILHISLRDLAPQAVLSCDNIVDDVDHVCRAETSIHLTKRFTGNRDFIRCCLVDILSGAEPATVGTGTKPHLFSPFGLGVLDLAAAALTFDLAVEQSVGTQIESFLPQPWSAVASK